MPGSLRYSAAAEADLLEIHVYTALRSPTAASRLLHKIDHDCRRLAEMPGLGARRNQIRPGMRLWTIGQFLVLYRIEADGIEVVRVVRGHRDLKKLFPPDTGR